MEVCWKLSFGKMAVDWEQRVDFDKLRKERVERTNKMMKKYGVGSLLLFGWDNRRYVSGAFANHPYMRHLPGNAFLLLRDAGFPYMRTEPAMEKFCPWLKDRLVSEDELSIHRVFNAIRSDTAAERWGKTAEQIKGFMKRHGVVDLPLGIDWTGPNVVKALEKAGIEVVDGNIVMGEARMVKFDEEIELMRQAATCNEAGYGAVTSVLRPGMRENDLLAIFAKAMYEAGAEYAEGWCMGSGERHHAISFNWSDRIIRPGEFFNLEACHVTFCGYKVCYDRTFFVGDEPTDTQKDAYQALVEMQEDFQKTLSQWKGMTTHQVWDARPVADPKKLNRGRVAWHGIGSGWGEVPARDQDEDFPVEQNMIFCTHTMGWVEGVPNTGVSLENTYRTTDTGWERLTKWPYKELKVYGY